LPLLLKALPAKDRPPLRRLEGNRCLLAALRTSRSGFGLRRRLPGDRRTQYGNALSLACLATFGFVLELLVVKEKLFACGKNKVRPAVNTLQHLILEVHPLTPFPGHIPLA
jgi:hypothetical protein